MTSLPTTFELSTDNTAIEHNFTNSPILRLPAELREKIWGFCLSNIQICIRPSTKQASDIRDYNYSWDQDRRLDIIPIPSTAGPDWTLTHRATYECTSAVCESWRHPPIRLSQLWRVCKLMYNETHHLPFAACNTINIHDFATFLLLYKIDRKTLSRIECLSLKSMDEFGLRTMLQMDSGTYDEFESFDQDIRHAKPNLATLLPVLKEVRLRSSEKRWASAGPGRSAGNDFPIMVQMEKARTEGIKPFWESLVANLIVVEDE